MKGYNFRKNYLNNNLLIQINWIIANPCLQCLTVINLCINKVLLYVKNNLSAQALRKDVHTVLITE